jgi:hypothetical protein
LDISARNEEAFRWACCNGYLQVAQWLYQIKPTLNISAENENAFRMACYNNNLVLALWLYQIKPTLDISAKNEEVFRHACYHNHLHLWTFKTPIFIGILSVFAFVFYCNLYISHHDFYKHHLLCYTYTLLVYA